MVSDIFYGYLSNLCHCGSVPQKYMSTSVIPALDSLGFGEYCEDAQTVLHEAKAMAAKKRRQSTKLENLGIPEEELFRQQQELFAKVWKLNLYIN